MNLVDAANVPDALSEICEKLRQGRYDDIETRRDAALRYQVIPPCVR